MANKSPKSEGAAERDSKSSPQAGSQPAVAEPQAPVRPETLRSEAEAEGGRMEDEVPLNIVNDAIQETDAEHVDYESGYPYHSSDRHRQETRKTTEVDSVDESFEFDDQNEDELIHEPSMAAILKGFVLANRTA